MPRAVPALIVIACCFAISQPQAQKADASALRVTEENGESVWRLSSGTVEMRTLVSHYSMHVSGALDDSKVSVFGNVTVASPKAGAAFSGEQIDSFVANALDQFRLRLVEKQPGMLTIVPAMEAAAVAPVLELEELKFTKSSNVVTCNLVLQHAEPNTLRAGLQNIVSRHGAGVVPLSGARGVAITDRCDRVRELVAFSLVLDERAKVETRFYALPDSVSAKDAAETLTGLFAKGTHTELVFEAAEGRHGITAQGQPHLHEAVAQAVAALK